MVYLLFKWLRTSRLSASVYLIRTQSDVNTFGMCIHNHKSATPARDKCFIWMWIRRTEWYRCAIFEYEFVYIKREFPGLPKIDFRQCVCIYILFKYHRPYPLHTAIFLTNNLLLLISPIALWVFICIALHCQRKFNFIMARNERRSKMLELLHISHLSYYLLTTLENYKCTVIIFQKYFR